ncbi:hypothetical protein QBC38DRAFT_492528 [Podospora fimiseda]|uniref:Uncharacterized protein n=1 Tax=Podospora fimiseda TaxID=252190 RepID=A0AAN6YND9_9PEZI|nr:hypothetical protein QBC38DRAFT_492528 [Podospora fimiseda]
MLITTSQDSPRDQQTETPQFTVRITTAKAPETLKVHIHQLQRGSPTNGFDMSLVITNNIPQSSAHPPVGFATPQFWIRSSATYHITGNERYRYLVTPPEQRVSLAIGTTSSPLNHDCGDISDYEDEDAQLEPDSPFAKDIDALTKEGYDKFKSSCPTTSTCSTKRPNPEPDSDQPKRCKLEIRSRSSHHHTENNDWGSMQELHCGTNWGVSIHQRRRRLLACPCYLTNPKRNRTKCLQTGGFTSINSLKSHIETAHLRDPYCPICHKVFTRRSSSNPEAERCKHIQARNCELRQGPMDIEGLQGDLMDALCELEPTGTETQKWLQIWETVNPGIDAPPTPYLDERRDKYFKIVQGVKGFWERKGRAVIKEFLQSSEEGVKAISACQDFEREVDILQEVVLREVVKQALLEGDG